MFDLAEINRSLKEEVEYFFPNWFIILISLEGKGRIYLFLPKKIRSSCLNYRKAALYCVIHYFVFLCDISIKL